MTATPEAIRFIKYCMVGVLNTLVTLGVIFVLKSVAGVNPYVCNAVGYAAGVTNSFLWNRSWVFRSSGGVKSDAARFLIGFGICYALQFALVWALNQSSFGAIEIHILGFTLSGYGIATLLGNCLYTLVNFAYNRLVAFK